MRGPTETQDRDELTTMAVMSWPSWQRWVDLPRQRWVDLPWQRWVEHAMGLTSWPTMAEMSWPTTRHISRAADGVHFNRNEVTHNSPQRWRRRSNMIESRWSTARCNGERVAGRPWWWRGNPPPTVTVGRGSCWPIMTETRQPITLTPHAWDAVTHLVACCKSLTRHGHDLLHLFYLK
jgi:hypothetical protein